MIVFKKVKLVNFVSHKETEFSITEGVHLVLGENRASPISNSNGAGKTAIFEAIAYAIYGKCERANCKRKGSKTSYVELEFDYKGDTYLIRRYYKDPIHKNTVEIYKNDTPLNFHTQSARDKFLEQIFKMKYQNFISAVIWKQGLDVRISALSPTQRKSYFSALIDENFDHALKEVKTAISIKESELLVKDEEYRELLKRKAYIEGQLKALQDQALDHAPEEIKQKLEALQAEYSLLLKQLEEEKNRYEEALKEFQTQKAKLQQKAKIYKTLLEKRICPVCRRPIEDPKDYKQKFLEAVNQLKTLTPPTKDRIEEIETRLSNIQNRINLLKVEASKLETAKHLQQKKQQLLTQLEEVSAQIKEKEKELTAIEAQLARLKEFQNLIQPSGELRTIVLRGYIDLYNQILQTIAQELFPETSKVELTPTKNFKGLEITGVNYKDLSGGEKRRLDFALQLAFTTLLTYIGGVDTNLVVIDEAFDNLDEASLEKVLTFLRDFYIDKAVYVVSHNPALKTHFESVIKVVKGEDGVSRLETA